MVTRLGLEISPALEARLKGLDSYVSFQVSGPEDPGEYRKFLSNLLGEFILWLAPEEWANQSEAADFLRGLTRKWGGEEDGIGGIHIGSYYLYE